MHEVDFRPRQMHLARTFCVHVHMHRRQQDILNRPSVRKVPSALKPPFSILDTGRIVALFRLKINVLL